MTALQRAIRRFENLDDPLGEPYPARVIDILKRIETRRQRGEYNPTMDAQDFDNLRSYDIDNRTIRHLL